MSYVADTLSNLIHQTAGLSEKQIFGFLREFCNFNVAYLAVVIKVIQNISDHVFKCGGGRKSGTLQNIGGHVCVKATDPQSVLSEQSTHARNKRRGCTVPHGVGGDIGVDVYDDLFKSFTCDSDACVVAGRNHRNHVQIHRGGNDTSMVMVGMIAGKFGATGDGKDGQIPVVSV